ncbi:MAG: DNA polymerase III subunit alpha [Prevotellaceae bacterium]|jgi:DNA polymerase-3 subunit alpha|nr:DNA polymerase III subunit alpha [Prevotellaceae bacterium]
MERVNSSFGAGSNRLMFAHLHVHTQYSVLDGASPIKALFAKALEDEQPAVAITDHGNMYGVKEFLTEAGKAGIKPVVGCEVYVARNSRFDKNGKEDQGGRHLILLAKNRTGYYNLVKLVSMGFTEGFYMRPRIDKEILFKYREGLIVSSACIGGEIPKLIRSENIAEAERVALEFKEYFGDDFYLEVQRHITDDPYTARVSQEQEVSNNGLIRLSQKFGIKLIATNDVHFVNREDAEAHDRLICINTGAKIGDVDRMRYTKQEWMKTRAEMTALFHDIPEAVTNTIEIVEKIEAYSISSKPIMPLFPIPKEFENDDDYLRHLACEGAKKRYGEISNDIQERIDFELETIKRMGYPGYFLIVQDFIAEARKMGVSVGPGRGSAAGSVVAYSLGITDIDPIKYKLLFERFLNPDRISMPDIDIDFDDDRRSEVLKYVEQKYGKEKVAHIITFGTMAAKSAIRDVARVQELPLPEADRLAKLVPEGPKVTLGQAFKEIPELEKELRSGDEIVQNTLKYAKVLEGSVRNTGVHACGIIIGRDDLTQYIPLCISRDKESGEEILVTQYDGSEVEDIGLLKMDFLGLKTLSLIKEALENIKRRNGVEIDISKISLEDEKTYELYSKGETVGTFQFESDGMRKWLKQLKPNKFEDLIAMNALYRPGPMEYIPDFITRKHGRKEITYDIPQQAEYLEDTYGITVYQEQVMLLSQSLAGFTKGEADSLRKAMGKKQKAVMDKMKEKFIDGGSAKGYDRKKLEKIWSDWEAFAEYAFNKSHSTCYSFVAYQTAYLKAHYPAEYMAAVLSCNLSNITEITKFMDECRRMGINVLGPDVNESYHKFTVNAAGDIRFGLAAIKNVGSGAVENIIVERAKKPFENIYDFIERVDLASVNKRNIESLAMAGAFDNMSVKREQFNYVNPKGESIIDILIRYGNKIQTDRMMATNSLFIGNNAVQISRPEMPPVSGVSRIELLNKEKELTGIFLSAHPLDDFRFEMENIVTHSTVDLQNIEKLKNKNITLGGMVIKSKSNISQNGNPWGLFSIEDYAGAYEFKLFGKDYEKFMQFMQNGQFLLIKANVQEKNYKKESTGEFEVKISQIGLLGNAKNDLRRLTINISINDISSTLVSSILNTVKNSQGKIEFAVRFVDKEKNLTIDMFSRKYRIQITPEMVSLLKNTELKYSID